MGSDCTCTADSPSGCVACCYTNQKGGDPISVAPVAPAPERLWFMNSLGVKVWETDAEYMQRTGVSGHLDGAMQGPPASMLDDLYARAREDAYRVCGIPGAFGVVERTPARSITEVLREVTAKAFPPVAPTTHAKGRRPTDEDSRMAARDASPALIPFEPYYDIDGNEIIGPGRSPRHSWLNPPRRYRDECMLGTPTVKP